MRFHTRKWVRPGDLNPNSTLDEEAALYAIIQLENNKVVTKYISEINFQSSAKKGDIVEIGIEVIKFGKASLTLACEVRNKMTRETIISVANIVMVNLDENGKPKAHGKTEIEFVKNRLNA